MSEPAFKYLVCLPFMPRPVSSEWVGSKFLDTLDALTQIDSNIFPDWEVGDLPAMKGYPLAAARSRIAEIVNHNVARDELGHPEPESGYAAVAHTTTSTKSRLMTFWAGTWLGQIWLTTGDYKVATDPAIVTFPLFKAALLAMNGIWQQPWACAQAFRSRTAEIPTGRGGYKLESLPMIPTDPTFPESIFHVPWFAYLSAPLASGIKPLPGIQTERLADGGVLLVVTEQRLDPDMPDHAQRAHILADFLIERTGYQPPGTTRA